MSNGKNNFANFDLDAERKILRRGGEIVPLPPKAVELLVVLVKNRGEVVSKNELLDIVWEGTFVEESVLSNNVYILRKTLAELGAGKDLIQTVPRRGYRFAAGSGDAEILVERHVFRHSAGAVTKERENSDATDLINSPPTSRTSSGSINSIAVLPLVNDTGSDELDYLSDGIAESLIDDLSLLPRLRVMARTTVFRYRSAVGENDFSPQLIGAELDVETVVTGRIRLLNNSLTVKIEMVRTSDAAQIWGEQYRREIADLLEMQTEIAREISGKLKLKLTAKETKNFPKRDTANPEAFQFYLKGRYFWNKRAAEWMKKGIEDFHRALDCDPNYAPAYSGLADSYISLATVGALSPENSVPKAKAAAQKALEIDDHLAEAHAALGFIKNNYDWNWSESEAHFKRAVEINPNYAIAYHWHGICQLTRRQFAESIELMKQAQTLDPLSPIINIACGLPFYYMRRYERAIRIYCDVIETDASFFPGHAYLGWAYEQNGQLKDAAAATLRALELSPGNTFALTSLGHIYAVSGEPEKARQIIGQLKSESNKRYITPYGMAEVYAGLRETGKVLAYLEQSLAERSWWLIFAEVNPRFDALRDEPRFRRILDEIKNANKTPENSA